MKGVLAAKKKESGKLQPSATRATPSARRMRRVMFIARVFLVMGVMVNGVKKPLRSA